MHKYGVYGTDYGDECQISFPDPHVSEWVAWCDSRLGCPTANGLPSGWRSPAGIGAGIYLATGIAAAASLSAPHARSKSIAVLMGGMASGTVLGVPLSLILADYAGWQSALWLTAGLGLISLIALWRKLPVLPALLILCRIRAFIGVTVK
ncbi:MFS transporter [Brenneria goodwinii]|uniref:MFS transporter n=1 Tax=Brenneria goodwinii TaxID=1109412 RepID=UPI0036E8F885